MLLAMAVDAAAVAAVVDVAVSLASQHQRFMNNERIQPNRRMRFFVP